MTLDTLKALEAELSAATQLYAGATRPEDNTLPRYFPSALTKAINRTRADLPSLEKRQMALGGMSKHSNAAALIIDAALTDAYLVELGAAVSEKVAIIDPDFASALVDLRLDAAAAVLAFRLSRASTLRISEALLSSHLAEKALLKAALRSDYKALSEKATNYLVPLENRLLDAREEVLTTERPVIWRAWEPTSENPLDKRYVDFLKVSIASLSQKWGAKHISIDDSGHDLPSAGSRDPVYNEVARRETRRKLIVRIVESTVGSICSVEKALQGPGPIAQLIEDPLRDGIPPSIFGSCSFRNGKAHGKMSLALLFSWAECFYIEPEFRALFLDEMVLWVWKGVEPAASKERSIRGTSSVSMSQLLTAFEQFRTLACLGKKPTYDPKYSEERKKFDFSGLRKYIAKNAPMLYACFRHRNETEDDGSETALPSTYDTEPDVGTSAREESEND